MRAALVLVALTLAFLPSPAPAADADRPRTDPQGDPLPAAALARLGSARYRADDNYLSAAALSPDGKLVAIAASTSVRLLDARTGKEVRRIRGGKPGELYSARRLCFSPDGKRLIVSGYDGVTVCDVAKGERLYTVKPTGRIGGASMSFSGDGKLMAVGSDGFRTKLSVLLWDIEANKEVKTVPVRQNVRAQALLSPDGKVLATWGPVEREDRRVEAETIQLWDVGAGKELRELKVDGYSVTNAAFSPDGKRLLVCEWGSRLVLWDVATGEPVRRFAARRGVGTILRYSADGKRIAAGSADGVVQIWDAATGRRVAQCQGPGGLVSVVPGEGDMFLALSHSGQAVRVWEAPSGRELGPRGGHENAVSTLAFSRDGKTLFSGGADGVRVWDVEAKKEVRRIKAPVDPRTVPLGDAPCHLTPDARYLIWVGRHDGRLWVVELASGQEVVDLESLGSGVDREQVSIAYAPGANTIATLGRVSARTQQDVTARVWDLGTGQEARTIKVPTGDNRSSSLVLSPDGKVLAVAPNSFRGPWVNTEVSLWGVSDGKQIAKFTVNSLAAMAFSPDGAVLATVGAGSVRLWDTTNGNEIRELRGGNNDWYTALTFSPDGRTLAVVRNPGKKDEGSKVLVWELVSGKVRAELSGQRVTTALAFSPDGRVLATGGGDTTVLLWDLTGRTELAGRAKGKPTADEVAALWADLDNPDAAKAHRAMARLSLAPAEALALLGKELKPVEGKALTDKEVARLIAQLEDDTFEVRERASQELGKAGRAVRPALVQALKSDPGAEKRRRLQELLDALTEAAPAAELIRPTRALELLERLRTPAARRLLESLATGNPHARLTTDAAAALRRLPKGS